MKTKYLITFGFVAIVLISFVWLRNGPVSAPASSGKAEAQKIRAKQSPAPDYESSASAKRIENSSRGRVLYAGELATRFAITGMDNMRLNWTLGRLAHELMEKKGLHAQIESFDGKILKLWVPRLEISDDEIKTAIMRNLTAEIGERKARAIWDDPVGQKTLMALVAIDPITSDISYTFKKIRDENDPAGNGSDGYASFDVGWGFNVAEEQERRFSNQVFKGFTFANTYNIALGWNAMSKVPAGYFRSEPITGVPNSSNPIVTVIEDLKSGEVEVWNARHPGSKDKIVVPPKG